MFATHVRPETTGDAGAYDFAALDTLMPHPVYAAQRWVCILNPTDETFQNVVRPLLVEAYEIAKARYGRARVESRTE